MRVVKGKFTNKKQTAIVALLERPTIKEAAAAVGIAEATIFRWLQVEEFQTAYREARRRVVELATSRLQKASGEAVGALKEVMNNPQSPASSRVMAARAVLEMSFKATMIEDLSARVEAMEKFLEKREKENFDR
jgi:hypothetical protein